MRGWIRLYCVALAFMVLCRFSWAADEESIKPGPEDDDAGILPNDLKMVVQGQTFFGPGIAIITDTTRDGKQDCNGIFLTQLHLLTTAHCVTNKQGVPVEPKRLLIKVNDLAIVVLQSPYSDLSQEYIPKIHRFKRPLEPGSRWFPSKSSNQTNKLTTTKNGFNSTLEEDDEMEDMEDPSETLFQITDRVTNDNQGGIFEISNSKGPSGVFARPRKLMGCWEYPNYEQDFKNQNLSHTIICTKPRREDSPCVGKAGCPIWVRRSPGDDTWKLVGLRSFSYTKVDDVVHECSNEGRVNIYTRLDAYLDWIAENTDLSISDLLNGTRDFDSPSAAVPVFGYYSLPVATCHFIFSLVSIIVVHAMY
ncbi:hypothetical protein IWQ62_003246 [Dispira parvispora]|uniref:Peptidase S1 domain-containing protein n=1 Tax=Dispira parvispora TaxID=1520584 RepID=A0A9W8ANA5_9FUNG|nr:hypothetical protein IWQ62_003246 [Dispira parvispora]